MLNITIKKNCNKEQYKGSGGDSPVSLIKNYQYQPQTDSKRRKQAIKKAITKNSFDSVFLSLKNYLENVSGYKTDRINNDLVWMKNECRKGRFKSEIIETEKKDRGLGSKYHNNSTKLNTQ